MKIAVIGAGGIGSVVAAYLSKAGVDVTLVGRQNQVDAISRKGLSIKGVRGQENFQLKVVPALEEECDLVVFTVKAQDLETAYQDNNTYLDDCYVLSSQNGVQADNILSVHFEPQKMLSSIVMFGATYVEPGQVTFNFDGDWIIGRPFSPVDPQAHKIADVLKKAFNVVVSDDIMGMKYLKLFVNLNNCIPAMIGKSMQETFADMDFCKLSVLLLKEGVKVMQNAKIDLISLPNFPKDRIYGMAGMPVEQGAGIIHQTLTTLSKEPLYGSILQSILRGKTSEIDFINGEVVQLGKSLNVDVALNDKIVDMVHQVESSGEYFSVEDVKKEFSLV